MTRSIVALFNSHEEAERLVRDLLGQGVAEDRVVLVAGDPEAEAQRARAVGAASKVEAVTAGGLIGLAGLASITIPGIGMALLAAPVAAALIEARRGVGQSYHEDAEVERILRHADLGDAEIRVYCSHIRQGQTVVAIRAGESQIDAIGAALHRYRFKAIEYRRYD